MNELAVIAINSLMVAFAPFLLTANRSTTKQHTLHQIGVFMLVLGFMGLVAHFCNIANTMAILTLLVLGFAFHDVRNRKLNPDAQRLLVGRLATIVALPVFTVFVVRAFLFDVFIIPSGSMQPNFKEGDLIVVNKFIYGVRLPIVWQKLIPISSPQRGDAVVFRSPLQHRENMIKRVIGLPGDHITYRNKHFYLNNEPLNQVSAIADNQASQKTYLALETIGARQYKVQIDDHEPSFRYWETEQPEHEACRLVGEQELSCVVPDGRYLMIGDNRDHSKDSRYIGYVDDGELMGRVDGVSFNVASIFSRVGTAAH